MTDTETPAETTGKSPSSELMQAPDATVLAERVRSAAWLTARDARIFALGGSVLLVADYQQTFTPFDGMERRWRRFALFRYERTPDGAGWVILDVATRALSTGGMDLLADERRDIDGDGADDLVLYHARMGVNDLQDHGLVAASNRLPRLVVAPLAQVISPDVTLWGDACWTATEGRPVLLVTWSDGEKSQTSGYVVTTAGLRAVRLFGRIVERGRDPEQLAARIPSPATSPGDDWDVKVPECGVPPGYRVLPAPRSGRDEDFVLLRGFAFSKTHLPSAEPGAPPGSVMELEPLEALVWPTAPALN